MDKRTYLEHLEAEYRSLTSREIEIASRKATLHEQMEKIRDELALERAAEPQQEETVVTTIPKNKQDEKTQEFIKQLAKRWKK